MRTKKTILLFSCILTILFSITTTFATDKCSVQDIDYNNEYYNGIKYVMENGISCGIGNNCFGPDLKITWKQSYVFVFKGLINNNYNLQDCLSTKPIDRWEYDLNSYLTRNDFFEIVFWCLDSETYTEYNTSTYRDNSFCTEIAEMIGLCEEDDKPSDLITRGEAAQIIYLLCTKQYDIPVNPVKITIEKDFIQENDFTLLPYLLILKDVPKPILDSFNKDGGEIIIGDNVINNYIEDTGVQGIAGLIYYGPKKIYITMPRVIPHEFIHYLDYKMNFPFKHSELYQKEAKNFTANSNYSYAGTNEREFFAECFSFWLSGDKRYSDPVKKYAPETYQYLKQLLNKIDSTHEVQNY